jgi:hypothetical protein
LTAAGARGTVGWSGREHSMNARIRGLAAAFVLVAEALAGASSVRAANLLEMNFWLSGPRYDAVVPLCDYPGALGKIQSRFATKEGRFWNSELKILGFEQVHEVAFMPWASGTIPRRFCTARAVVSDGKVRPIHYSIAEDTGIIGATYGVEWCVVGLDRNWAYNPSCKMARP